MNVTVVGVGCVGLTTAVALAYLENNVICVDKNQLVIDTLLQHRIAFYEPGLDALLAKVRNRLRFTTELTVHEAGADVILICVGTPSQPSGDADLSFVEEVATSIAETLPAGSDAVVCNKATVPVGSAQRVESILKTGLAQRSLPANLMVASNPEFLREGSALYDTFYPERIVVGTAHRKASDRLRALYGPILEQTFAPPPGLPRPEDFSLPIFLTTTPTSAELSKYAANAFLAMKISFANEIGGIAERVGGDVTEVMRVVGLDGRIGPRYLGAGAGWGGSCFGKDVRALLALGEQYGYKMPLARGALEVNTRQRQVVVEKLQQALKVVRGRTIAIWGLTFKPNTDDLRDAPAVDVAYSLLDMGARVRVFDPVGMERAQREHPRLFVEYASSPIDAVCDADAVVLMTEWPAFLHVDWQEIALAMREPIVIDGRNVLDATSLKEKGFQYRGMGR